MPRQESFTIAAARRNRISEQTRSGYNSGINQIKKWATHTGQHDLLGPCSESRDGTTLDLSRFHYRHFLSFVEWTVQNKDVEVGTISGYRSAIQSLYKDRSVPLPEEYGDDIKEVFSGLRKSVANGLQAGEKLYRGKRPMTFDVFELLCEKSIALSDGGFAHAFLVLSWNLMCRSKSTETVRFDHMTCVDDSIGFTFFKTKTSQEGTKNKDPKHCYSNPFKPMTCLYVALGLYLACNSRMSPTSLFPGSNQKDRFGKSLSALVGGGGTNAKKDIGTHSIRKGAATFVSSGSTGGPSIVSVCLRCGWSLGNVMERYFRYEAAGDQFTGRCVAGLPLNSADFAILPPHFSALDNAVVAPAVQLMFPSLCSEVHLVPVLRLVLASLVYHHDFLLRSLPSHHALLSTSVFTSPALFESLRSIVKYGSKSPAMRASGIPPYVEMYRKLEQNEVILTGMSATILDGVRSIVETNGVAAGNITRSVLESSIANALTTVQQSHPINGAQVQAARPSHPDNHGHQAFNWGGKFHKLPENFVLPSVDAATAWKLWWLGNAREKILPFRKIDTQDLPHRAAKNTFYEWKYVMDKLTDHFVLLAGHSLAQSPTEHDVSAAFDVARGLFAPIHGQTAAKRTRRDGQLKVATLVRLLRQQEPNRSSRPYKKRKVNSQTAGRDTNLLL